MFVRAYLRASTDSQDATRAKSSLERFVEGKGSKVAATYVESASGACATRKELSRLLDDSHEGDILLVESIDRLSRLGDQDWKLLRARIDEKSLRIVALDLPTSHMGLSESSSDEFTARMLDAVNSMMLDMMAAIARKDYEQRRERQQQGIEKAKAEGKFRGRKVDVVKRERIKELLNAGFSVRKAARHAGASTHTVQRVKKEMLSK